MKLLVAEDNPLTRKSLESMLTIWGFQVISVEDGISALRELQAKDAPLLAVIDRIMPGLNGDDICRLMRSTDNPARCYIILLTAMESPENIVQGLNSGADDYVTKPFDPEELQARVRIGSRLVSLQLDLAKRVEELEAAVNNVRQLEGLLPICASCKKIRDEENYWHQVEKYITVHSKARFTHSCCPECYAEIIASETCPADK